MTPPRIASTQEPIRTPGFGFDPLPVMEFIVVNHPQPRTALSGGNAIGPTNQILAINGGLHTFTLSDPQDYVPPSQRLVVAGTSVATPLNVTFTPAATMLAAKFPAAVFSGATAVATVDALVAQLAPLGLVWRVEKNGTFGAARAQAIFDVDPRTGEAWVIAALEDAASAPHQHNAGGPYGELLFTLAGQLNDTLDGGPIVLAAGSVVFHAPDTVHAPSATGFWAGLFHQPRGVTAV